MKRKADVRKKTLLLLVRSGGSSARIAFVCSWRPLEAKCEARQDSPLNSQEVAVETASITADASRIEGAPIANAGQEQRSPPLTDKDARSRIRLAVGRKMIGSSRWGWDDGTRLRGGRDAVSQRRHLLNAEATASVNTVGGSRDFATQIHRLPEERRQLVFRVRREIAEGVYDTADKLEIALERMIDRVIGDDDEY